MIYTGKFVFVYVCHTFSNFLVQNYKLFSGYPRKKQKMFLIFSNLISQNV